MDYLQRFPGKAVFPVIHADSMEQVRTNLRVVKDSTAEGAFLIDHHHR